MFQRKFKNPFSLISFFIIVVAYLLVYCRSSKSNVSGLNFLIYIFIFLSGIGFTRRTLLFWFPDLTTALTLLALAFGTNLFYMVSLDYQLQPILLFSLYAMVVFFTAAWHKLQKQTYAVLLAICLGLIILLQPTGMFSLLIPVLWGVHDKASWKSKILMVKNNSRQVLLFFCVLLVLVIPLLIFWKISPGEISGLSFKLPGFFISFSSFLWSDLFWFDHGWLIYTPLMVLALIGFYYFADKNRPIFYPVFLFFILDLFMETSWSALGTTTVFGQVAFIPAYALLVFPIGALLGFIQGGKPGFRIILAMVTAMLILLNIFQTWQFSNGIILHSGMTADNYGQVIGRTGVTEIEKLQMAGIEPAASLVFKDKSKFRKVKLAFFDFEDTHVPYSSHLESDHVKNGKMALTMDSTCRFSPGFQTRYSDFTKKSLAGMRITASVFVLNPEALAGVNLVVSSKHEGKNYRYRSLNLGDLKLKPGIWNTLSFDYSSPPDPYPDDLLVSYVWYTGITRIYIDDLTYEAFELRK